MRGRDNDIVWRDEVIIVMGIFYGPREEAGI